MFFSIFSACMLIVGGILALYGLIVARAPDIKEEFDKIIPYQGVIGVVLLLMGIRDFIHFFEILNTFRSNFLGGILGVAALMTKLVLGFVLSFGLITKYVLSNNAPTTTKKKGTKSRKQKKGSEDTRQDKTNKMYTTLTYVQVPFGIVSILLGFLALLFIVISFF